MYSDMKKYLKNKLKKEITKKLESTQKPHKYYKIVRKSKYYGFGALYKIKGLLKDLYFEKNIKNIYHASIQKTGSQWIKSIFSDRRVRKETGMSVYPQLRYEYGEFKKKFPPYTFVPCLYIPYNLYEEIEKPDTYKTFYIMRDPRNVVISWYKSMLKSHRTSNKRVASHREFLTSVTKKRGIIYCIKNLSMKFGFIKNWAIMGRDDENVKIVRFEDLTQDTNKEFKNLFSFLGIDINSNKLEKILDDYSKTKMRKRDEQKRAKNSNYTQGGSNWKEEFCNEHTRLFNELYGDLLAMLKYDS